MSHSRITRLFGAAALLFLSSPLAAAPTITNLGMPLGASSTSYDRLKVNHEGSAFVGICNFPEGAQHAFRWSAGAGVADLGSLPANSTCISASGVYVGGSIYPPYYPVTGYRWSQAGGMQSLGFAPSTSQTWVQTMSDDGAAITGIAWGEFYVGVFLWTSAGGIEGLWQDGGMARWIVVSGDGSTITGRGPHSSPYEVGAFRWTRSTGRQPISRSGSEGTALNFDGSVVAGTTSVGAFRWTARDGAQDVGDFMRPIALSDDGSVMVGDAAGSAVLWVASLGVVNLNTYLPTIGLDLTGWSLASCSGISGDGSTLVCIGTYNGNAAMAVVRDLPPFPCSLSDIVGIGGLPPRDGLLTGDDFIAYINAFAAADPLSDIVSIGGFPPPDGLITGDDFVSFINAFAAGCP